MPSTTLYVQARIRGLAVVRALFWTILRLPLPKQVKLALGNWSVRLLRVQYRLGEGEWRTSRHRFHLTAKEV